MKKLCIFMACIMACAILSACEKRDEEKATDTTPLTLTESFTSEMRLEPVPEEEKVEVVEFAIFNPFANAVKVDSGVNKELAEALKRHSDGRGFLWNHTAFYGKSDYYFNYVDEDVVLEENLLEEYSYCKVNPDFAETEEELTEKLRSIFTEEYISDEEMHEVLFMPENENVPQRYKTIDGVLCMRCNYMGVYPAVCYDEIISIEVNGNSAVVIAKLEDVGGSMATIINFEKSEEYGWRAVSEEQTDYWDDVAVDFYNAIVLRTETLNEILGGGQTPPNAKTLTIDGESYTETKMSMSLTDMYKYFENTFAEETAASENETAKPLLADYSEKYISSAYAEQDGILYRKDSAPKWYLPDMYINPFDAYENSFEKGNIYPFNDPVTGETFDWKVNTDKVYADDPEGIYFRILTNILISSELPIREYTEVE